MRSFFLFKKRVMCNKAFRIQGTKNKQTNKQTNKQKTAVLWVKLAMPKVISALSSDEHNKWRLIIINYFRDHLESAFKTKKYIEKRKIKEMHLTYLYFLIFIFRLCDCFNSSCIDP